MNSIKETFNSIQATNDSKERVFTRVMKPKKKHFIWKPIVAIATACVIIFATTSIQAYANVVSYVSVDVNPSIELGLNKYDQVVSVVAYNQESQALCDSLSLKDKTIEQALSLLLEDESLQTALNDNSLYITVTSDQETQLLTTIESLPAVQAHQGNCQGASSEVHSEAHNHGMTVSRYNAYLSLQENGVAISETEINDLTMNQIHELCLEHGVEDTFDNCAGNNEGPTNNNNSGNGTGSQEHGNSDGGHHGNNGGNHE